MCETVLINVRLPYITPLKRYRLLLGNTSKVTLELNNEEFLYFATLNTYYWLAFVFLVQKLQHWKDLHFQDHKKESFASKKRVSRPADDTGK
jgi:hypothetical protein